MDKEFKWVNTPFQNKVCLYQGFSSSNLPEEVNSLEVMVACHSLHPCQFSAEQL